MSPQDVLWFLIFAVRWNRLQVGSFMKDVWFSGTASDFEQAMPVFVQTFL